MKSYPTLAHSKKIFQKFFPVLYHQIASLRNHNCEYVNMLDLSPPPPQFGVYQFIFVLIWLSVYWSPAPKLSFSTILWKWMLKWHFKYFFFFLSQLTLWWTLSVEDTGKTLGWEILLPGLSVPIYQIPVMNGLPYVCLLQSMLARRT